MISKMLRMLTSLPLFHFFTSFQENILTKEQANSSWEAVYYDI